MDWRIEALNSLEELTKALREYVFGKDVKPPFYYFQMIERANKVVAELQKDETNGLSETINRRQNEKPHS
jgi:hypothetical protein